MRYCLACRRLSADGPLCTSCGRSFGGRLCNNKKGRHLNPSTANVCGQCGSTVLTDSANYLGFAWLGRVFLWGGLLGGVCLYGPPLLHRVGDALGVTRYRDPRVWALEGFFRLLMPFAMFFWVFYGIACFVPGEGGKMLRSAMIGTLRWVLQTLLKAVGSIGSCVSTLLMNLLSGRKTKT